MEGFRAITPGDVIALLDKIRGRSTPLSSSPPSPSTATAVAVANLGLSSSSSSSIQSSSVDDHDTRISRIFVDTQQQSQSQLWPIDDEDSEPLEVQSSVPPPTPPAASATKMSSLDRYLTPPFKQSDKYIKLYQIVYVLRSIQEALITGTNHQVRRIFYLDKVLFGDISCVGAIVRCLEDYWKVPSSSFNVLAAYKGMMAGPIGYSTKEAFLKARRESSSKLTSTERAPESLTWACTWSPEGESGAFVYKAEDIVDASQIQSLRAGKDISWVLVVEKETVFSERVQELNRDSDGAGTLGHGIILTGKGMPDFATRRMLELLARALPEGVPFYALVDGDAYGMHIYHTYCSNLRYWTGAQKMKERLRWIGLKPSDSLSILGKYASSAIDGSLQGSGAVPVDLNEHSRAHLLATSDQDNKELQQEALRLMLYGYKLELEAIANRPFETLLPLRENRYVPQALSSPADPLMPL